jgi:hypothetical protein
MNVEHNPYEDLPEGLNLLCQCERTATGTVLVLRVPKHVTPSEFPQWCVDNVPLGFHPAEVAIATDEQCEAMEY